MVSGRWLAAGILAAFLAGCAGWLGIDVVRSPMTPVDDAQATVIQIEGTLTLTLDNGITRTIERGTHWKLVGSIVEGKVYRPLDGEFTIEGHEPVSAYLVISSGQLVGFFLPVEEGFSPLFKRVSVSFVPSRKG
jgi:hypothetical protein